MKNISLFVLIFVIASVRAIAADGSIIDQLNQEEATWHKAALFSTASSPKDATQYLAVLDWLKTRVQQPNVPDSRYAMTYSMMLGGTKDPKAADTANAFAIIGYAALQIDTARCTNRAEALVIARQWYDTVRGRLLSVKDLPLETRTRYWGFAESYLNLYFNRREGELIKSSAWICNNLPSYINTIQKLPDVKVETLQGQKGQSTVLYSHPTVLPDLATQEVFENRVKTIMPDIKNIVLEEKK